MASGDFYAALGVPRTANQDEIQRAYRKLARRYHPDVNKDPEAEERFKEVAEAYDVLADPETRRRYDAFGPDFRQVPEGVDPAAWARARAAGRTGAWAGAGTAGAGWPGGARAGAGRAGPGRGGGTRFGGGVGAEGIDLDDLLGGFFGGAAGPGWGPIPGADQEAELELSVDDAYRGGHRTVTLAGPEGPRRFDVTIPAGVTDGQRIRLAGQGARGSDGAPPGDLYLIVRLRPDPYYRVAGRDLSVDLLLTPAEAALGASVGVRTPAGEAKVTVPPGTSSGRRLRLRGRGLPNPRGRAGDLFAVVRVMVPEHPTEEERRLFAELAAVSDFDPRRSS